MKPFAHHPRDLQCEIYNPNDYTVSFHSDLTDDLRKLWFHPLLKKGVNCFRVDIKPGEWAWLPHQWFTAYRIQETGGLEKFNGSVITNLGLSMFRGNKHASAPEVRKTLFKGI